MVAAMQFLLKEKNSSRYILVLITTASACWFILICTQKERHTYRNPIDVPKIWDLKCRRSYEVVGHEQALFKNTCANNALCTLNIGRKKPGAVRSAQSCTVKRCVTAIVTTTGHRKALVRRLLISIKTYAPGLATIVIENGNKNFSNHERGSQRRVKYLSTGSHNSSISHARNVALRYVWTDYVLILEDDFEFDAKTNLTLLLYLLQTTDVDVAGGVLGNCEHVFEGLFKVITAKDRNAKLIHYPTVLLDHIPHHPQCFSVDITTNFFMARTKVIQSVGGWDERFPICEHKDFFLNLRQNNVKVAVCLDVMIKHSQPVTHQLITIDRTKACKAIKAAIAKKWGYGELLMCPVPFVDVLKSDLDKCQRS